MKKKLLFIGMTSTLLASPAFADSLAIENPDKLNIDIYYGNNVKITSAKDRFYDARNPAKDELEIRVVVEGGDVLQKSLKSSATMIGSSGGCNYSMIISRDRGWKLNGNGKGCSASEDHYHPATSAVYTLINHSAEPVYPAFALEGEEFAADSILGYLRPGESRMYDGDTAYWKHLGIKSGSKITTAVFEPYLQKYISCSEEMPVNDDKTFIYKSDKTCSDYKELETGARVEGATKYTVLEADRGITIHYKTPDDASDYYVIILKSDRSAYGSTGKVKAGEGQIVLPVRRAWHPKGGQFVVAITKYPEIAQVVQTIGERMTITVTP